MHKFYLITLLTACLAVTKAPACTNFLLTKGATKDGSTMITYAADSHVLYGELYHWPAGTWAEGTMMDIYEWDTGKYMGQIPQASQTYNVIGNMNEFQLAIGETTYGGLEELASQSGAIMDYGSAIYITLQRAKNAREAIVVMTKLFEDYGYASAGESFSIVDPNEVRWYLASIDQLTDIYLGELALDEVSRLYPSNPADRNNQTRWHYTSSSANDQNNSWILWAEEGASRGGSSGSIMDNGSQNTKFSYRCVRNLGISLDNPAEVPKDLVQVISESDGNILIDMSFMNAKARRSSYVTELPSHNEREDANRPYAKFRVHKDAFGSNQPWYFYQTNDPSPTGYRIPNQRELLIMTSRLSSSQWPSGKNQYISQTAFSMYNTGIYRDYTTDGTTIMREGFLWHTNGNFYLQNNRGETGWVRPVQDVR